jgi:hypothetical protein
MDVSTLFVTLQPPGFAFSNAFSSSALALNFGLALRFRPLLVVASIVSTACDRASSSSSSLAKAWVS